jgi:hypothetical protein
LVATLLLHGEEFDRFSPAPVRAGAGQTFSSLERGRASAADTSARLLKIASKALKSQERFNLCFEEKRYEIN